MVEEASIRDDAEGKQILWQGLVESLHGNQYGFFTFILPLKSKNKGK